MLRDPFDDINRLRGQLQRLLDQSFGLTGQTAAQAARWSPATDIYADDGRVVVTLEVCGFQEDELEVTLHGAVLTVTGRPAAADTTTQQHIRRERNTGPFSRSFALAWPPSTHSAHLKDGVLTITLTR